MMEFSIEVNEARAGEIDMTSSTDGGHDVTVFVTEAEMSEIQWHALRINELHPELAPHEAFYKALQLITKASK